MSTKSVPSSRPGLRPQYVGLHSILRGQIRNQQARLDRVLDQRSRAAYGGRGDRLASKKTSQIVGMGLSGAESTTSSSATNSHRPTHEPNRTAESDPLVRAGPERRCNEGGTREGDDRKGSVIAQTRPATRIQRKRELTFRG